jgi:hypothetical protein
MALPRCPLGYSATLCQLTWATLSICSLRIPAGTSRTLAEPTALFTPSLAPFYWGKQRAFKKWVHSRIQDAYSAGRQNTEACSSTDRLPLAHGVGRGSDGARRTSTERGFQRWRAAQSRKVYPARRPAMAFISRQTDAYAHRCWYS